VEVGGGQRAGWLWLKAVLLRLFAGASGEERKLK